MPPNPIEIDVAGLRRWAFLGTPAAHADFVRRASSPEARGCTLFLAKDAEELDRAVLRGEFGGVVSADLATLMSAVLDGDIRLDEWARRGVCLEWAEGKGASGSFSNPASPTLEALVPIQTAIADWHARLRRRRAVAGCVLSAVAIASAAALVALARR